MPSKIYGSFRSRTNWFGNLLGSVTNTVLERKFNTHQFFATDSDYARERIASMREKLAAGKTVYLLGIGPSAHNTGVALLRASSEKGIELLCNDEEERYTAVKHCRDFPAKSLAALRQRLDRLGVSPEEIHAALASWDYVAAWSGLMKGFMSEVPTMLKYLSAMKDEKSNVAFSLQDVTDAMVSPGQLGEALGLGRPLPIIRVRHHDTHAYLGYALSPFARSSEKTAIGVLDGFGDDGAVSLYVAENGRVKHLHSNKSYFDSLGIAYSFLSSTQGGWPILSSEGRYMGAAAWGNGDRLTNPYYKRLRQLFYFGPDGELRLNELMAHWHIGAWIDPYKQSLSEVLGPPISTKKMWNPDAVLNVDDVVHADITRERVDKAAAVQLFFEDGLFHVVEHLLRLTGASNLVLAGGTALNCVANMRLLDKFDEAYFERYFGKKDTRLHLWVPPMPGDAGAPAGAAIAFAMYADARPGAPMRHAFLCGTAPTTAEINEATKADSAVSSAKLGNANDAAERRQIADFAAMVIADGGVLGIFQGVAETGPRALGHRSILADPTNPTVLETLNARVKFRERIRPLAPMVTREAAEKYFELSPGVSDDDYNGYNYMVLTARARPESRAVIPAAIHRDGTGRIQIVRPETDPFCYELLKAMGRRRGVEVCINTSLNVGAPIVQTPAQAVETLKRAKGMAGLLMIGADGKAFVAWHHASKTGDIDDRMKGWLARWRGSSEQPASPAAE